MWLPKRRRPYTPPGNRGRSGRRGTPRADALPEIGKAGPARRLALRAADHLRVAGRQVREQLRVGRLAQLPGHRLAGRLDHDVAPLLAHQVDAHGVEVLAKGLDQHHLGAALAELLRLAAEASSG